MRFDCLLVDVVNVVYKFYNREERPSYVSKKQVYKDLVASFIKYIESVVETHLHSDGDIYMLFDNVTSRIDLQSTFYFANRKEAYAKYKSDRAKQPKEFYNSINLLKFYYLTLTPNYKTIQINMLEADDLVEPVLRLYCKDKKTLMLTNDLDWARFLDINTFWINSGLDVTGVEELEEKLGFPVTQTSITAYKVLFGDPSDNIPAIVPGKLKPYFNALLDMIKTADDLPYISTLNEELNPIISHIFNNQRQCRINLQLVNSIPVSDKHIKYAMGKGRDSGVSRKAVRQAVGLDNTDKGFTFGGIKRPRI